jgi:hypothetical protein
MSAHRIRLAALPAVAALVAFTACAPAPHGDRWANVIEATPSFLAGTAAFDPAIAVAPGGRVALTYVTRDTGGADVWIALSADSGGHFSGPERLNLRRGVVSSHPEGRPVAVFAAHDRLVVAWASARDSGGFDDNIVARASDDGGASFGPETILNDDGALPGAKYHGFVALDATPQGRLVAAWVDGRSVLPGVGGTEPEIAEIWSATSDDGGATWSANRRLAAGACTCCRPALRAGGSIVAIAYRSVRDSLRDPRLAISRDGGATIASDTALAGSGWKTSGCPSTGPALALNRDGGWISWYSGAGGRDGVYADTWREGRGSSGMPIAIDDTLHECDHPMLAGMGTVTLAGVLAQAGASRRVLALRTLGARGELSPWLLLGAAARSAAIAAQDTRHALAAWVEQTDTGPRVRFVRVTRR